MRMHNIAKKELEHQIQFGHWIQEFSKKIVTITFIIYVVIHVYLLIMFTIEYFTAGNMEDMSNLLSETHTTFREVIGFYFLKAAIENSGKVGGSVIERYWKSKYQVKEEETVYEQEEVCSDARSEDV